MKSTVLTALLLLSASLGGPAAQQNAHLKPPLPIWEPPHSSWPEDLPAATTPKELLTTLQVGKLQIQLDVTRLDVAGKILGGVIGSRGDAGDSLGWLCLKGADANGSWALWLESSEINGETIGGFDWLRVARDAVFDPRCVSVSTVDGGLKFPIVIRLDMSESQLRSVFGPPTWRRGDTNFYLHEHREIIRSEPFTASNGVSAALQNGAVTEIQAWKTTSD